MRTSNPLSIALVIVFVAGAMLFVIGTMLTRARHIPPQPDVEPAQAPLEVRIDMVERLAMVGQSWCVEQLNQIRDNDPDESVREAADAALLVIGSRPPASP